MQEGIYIHCKMVQLALELLMQPTGTNSAMLGTCRRECMGFTPSDTQQCRRLLMSLAHDPMHSTIRRKSSLCSKFPEDWCRSHMNEGSYFTLGLQRAYCEKREQGEEGVGEGGRGGRKPCDETWIIYNHVQHCMHLNTIHCLFCIISFFNFYNMSHTHRMEPL